MANPQKPYRDEDFPKRLRQLINEDGRVLEVIAADVQVSKTNLSDWQTGKTMPRADSLRLLAKYFNVTTDYLLGLTDARTIDTDLRAAAEYTGLSDDAIRSLHTLTVCPIDQRERISQLIECGALWDLVRRLNNFASAMRAQERKRLKYKEELTKAKTIGRKEVIKIVENAMAKVEQLDMDEAAVLFYRIQYIDIDVDTLTNELVEISEEHLLCNSIRQDAEDAIRQLFDFVRDETKEAEREMHLILTGGEQDGQHNKES